MIVLDFQCKGCGNSKKDVLVKTYDETIQCEVCDARMERMYTGTVYTSRPSSGTPVPQHLLGGGNKANFGIME